jgi:cytidylate kinase
VYAYKSIVVSGLTGGGKTSLATALSKTYGWPMYSIGELWRTAYEQAHPKKDITLEEFFRRTTKDDNMRINAAAKLLFESGNVIGESRYTSILNKSVCLLVFLTADMAVRVQRVQNREEYANMTAEELAATLETREKDDLDKGRELYGEDYDYRDPKNYHLVLDTTKMSTAQCVDAVNRLMNKSL